MSCRLAPRWSTAPVARSPSSARGGLIFVRGEQAILYVQWGKDRDQQCRLDYRVPEPDPAVPYQQVAARCLTMEASS
ncbi:FimD/PapC C-terminal domain-containing protein [Aeromonas encheleia]